MIEASPTASSPAAVRVTHDPVAAWKSPLLRIVLVLLTYLTFSGLVITFAPFSVYNSSSPEQIAYLLGHSEASVVNAEPIFEQPLQAALRAMTDAPALVLLENADDSWASRIAAVDPVDLRAAAAVAAAGDLETIRATRIATPGGAQIPLSALAEIRKDRGPNTISRENVERKAVVMSNVAGRDLTSVVEDIRDRVTATVDPSPNEKSEGTVKTIGGVIDPKTRTMFAEAEFANRDGRLRPGLFARVEAKLD